MPNCFAGLIQASLYHNLALPDRPVVATKHLLCSQLRVVVCFDCCQQGRVRQAASLHAVVAIVDCESYRL
jgi:hypothetical protein